VIDDVLDRTVAPGYGRLGLAVRRRLPGWPADPPRMDGKVVLVTGAASGLGLAAAQGFARLGASVRAHGRNDERAADAVDAVREAVPGADVRPVAFDASSVAAIRGFAKSLDEDRLDVLVANAGVMPPERTHTDEGVELMFATHVLGTYVLIDELSELLRASAPSRVIVVTSGGMYGQKLPAGDPQSERTDYSPSKFYARTKRQQVVLTEQWAEKLRGTGVAVHSMHPGWADTAGLQSGLPGFAKAARTVLRTADDGADTIVWLGGAPDAMGSSGRFWHDRRQRPTHYALGAGEDTPAARAELWETCVRLAR